MAAISIITLQKLTELVHAIQDQLPSGKTPGEVFITVGDQHSIALWDSIADQEPIAIIHLGLEEIKWNLDTSAPEKSPSQKNGNGPTSGA